MKLVIAGSRTLVPKCDLYNMFELVGIDHNEIEELITGGCATGVDNWAHNLWQSTIFNADWDKYGKAAGPIRNKQMAEYGDALLLIWDSESKGSANMKSEMIKLKKPIYEVILKTYNGVN